MTDYRKKIEEILNDVDPILVSLCQPMLCPDSTLDFWPAAVAKHHAYWGGLLKHTYEVLRFAMDAVRSIPKADRSVIAVAAVWHDYGKRWDYAVGYVDRDKEEIGDVSYTDTANMIGHLSISAVQFDKFFDSKRMAGEIVNSSGVVLGAAWKMKVLHAIIGHHGRKEWGSPREPQTVEALVIHQADVLSVMVDTNHNPQLRNGPDKKPEPEFFKAEDLTEGDMVVYRKLNDKSAERHTGVFVRLDGNNCPVVRLSGNLVKVPLRTIQQITPPQDEPIEKTADKTPEREDTGVGTSSESTPVLGSDSGRTSELHDSAIREEHSDKPAGTDSSTGSETDGPPGA